MTPHPMRTYKALILGELGEIDDIFALQHFQEDFPITTIKVDELAEFEATISDPEIDLVLIDARPHGLDALEAVLRSPPMRPVIMVADPDHADVILEAKDRGLDRYLIRLDDHQRNIDLLSREISSVLRQLVEPPAMEHPTVDHLFRFAQYHNVRQPFFVVGLHRRLLYINKAGIDLIEVLHGRCPEIGDDTGAFFLDDTSAKFHAHLDRAFDGETVEVAQFFEALPAGAQDRQVLYQPVRQSDAGVVAVSIACKDVGARRRAEERLEYQRKILWRYFDSAPLPLSVVNDDLTIERCNQAFAELLGFEQTEPLRGRAIESLAHPDDREELCLGVERIFSGDDAYFQTEHRYCDRRDKSVWVNHIGYTLGEVDGNHGALMVAVDVTRRREAELRAEQSMRMEAIGQLAGGVAHDFNNILAVVSAISHIMKTQLTELPDSALVEYLDKIEKAVESGTSLTRQLLGFSQKRSVDRERIDLNFQLRDLIPLLERAAGDDVEMRLRLQTDLAPIEIGKGQFDQVIMNLVVNARDAMPDGGVLSIRTYRASGSQAPPDLKNGDWVVLEVSDEGIGMDRETRRRAFDPFFTTKKPGEGTGMGLATVYRVVNSTGGKIYVDSSPGMGTKFTIYFPRASHTAIYSTADNDTAEAQSDRACILLVEDEDDIREPYRIFLENSGHRVVEADSVQQAYNVVETSGDEIDLLLADVILPDGSGVDLAKQLQDRIDGLKIIFISGYAPDLIYKSDEALKNRWQFLPKPVTREKLLITVGNVLTSS